MKNAIEAILAQEVTVTLTRDEVSRMLALLANDIKGLKEARVNAIGDVERYGINTSLGAACQRLVQYYSEEELAESRIYEKIKYGRRDKAHGEDQAQGHQKGSVAGEADAVAV